MSVLKFKNRLGTFVSPLRGYPAHIQNSGASTLNATGETASVIGRIHLETGPGTSATLSSGNGRIYFALATATFADAGTVVRVGLQDITASGVENQSFDVYAEYVGGTDTLVNSLNGLNKKIMTSGTKTVNHGDDLAIVVSMVSRSGSDSIAVRNCNTPQVLPYGTLAFGGAPSKASTYIFACIEFDDGTLGWFWTENIGPIVIPSTFGPSSNPDEKGLVFRMPFDCKISQVFAEIGSIGATSDFEFLIYTDPLGTPSVAQTLSHNFQASRTTAGGGGKYHVPLITPFQVVKNTDYGLMLRPTGAGGIQLTEIRYYSGNAHLRRMTMLGEDWAIGSRQNQSGAFTLDTTVLPHMGFYLEEVDLEAISLTQPSSIPYS